MELLHLKYFQTVVRHDEHMTRAAKELSIAQPALGQIISRLEGIVPIRIEEPPCQRTIVLAWKEGRYQSVAVQTFKQFAIDFFHQLERSVILHREGIGI